jgi:hypothetical protein
MGQVTQTTVQIQAVLTAVGNVAGVSPTNTAAVIPTTVLTDALALKAPLASPVFTGNPQAPTPLVTDGDTSVATTAFVKSQNDSIVVSRFYRTDNVVAVTIPVTITINSTASTGLSLTKNAAGQPLSIPAPESKANASVVYDRSASITSPINQGNVVASTQTQNRTLNIGATNAGVTNIVQSRTITRNSRKEIITISAWA